MHPEEFLERFALADTTPFVGRGPHRARDRQSSDKEVLVHLFNSADPREAELVARVSELSGGAFRVYDLHGAFAVVTPSDLSYQSLEGWLESLPAARDSTKQRLASATTKPFSIRVRKRETTGDVPAAHSVPRARATPPSEQTPPASDPVMPPDLSPAAPAPPPPAEKEPGLFTLAFGGPQRAKPGAPPPPPAPLSPPTPISTPAARSPSAPNTPPAPPPPRAESQSSFTQLFGGSGVSPVQNPVPDPLQTPGLLAPKFRVEPPQPPPISRPPTPSPPPPAVDPGEFTRFFGIGAAGAGVPAAEPPRAPQPPSWQVPSPGLGSLVPPPMPAANLGGTPKPADETVPPPFSGGDSLFTRVVKGAAVAGAAKQVIAAGESPGATSAEPNAKKTIVPIVLVLSVAAVAVLGLILVFILAR